MVVWGLKKRARWVIYRGMKSGRANSNAIQLPVRRRDTLFHFDYRRPFINSAEVIYNIASVSCSYPLPIIIYIYYCPLIGPTILPA